MCGGFTCSKNALTALTVIDIVVGIVLIVAAVYGRALAQVTNLPIISGILGCGVFLILVSVLGLFGAVKHNQVMLFFYMIIVFIIFLVQFSIACTCLAVSLQEQEKLAQEGWGSVSADLKKAVQNDLSCCGFDGVERNSTDSMGHPPCDVNNCAPESQCPPCRKPLLSAIDYAFRLCGGIGLFFSFTEFIGVWLTVRYRNQKDPRANPSAFL